MSKADKIEKGIMTFAKVGTIGAVVLYFLGKRKKESTSGIGDVPVWNKGHIKNWLAYEHYDYPEKIIVTDTPYYLNDDCVAVWSYNDRDARNWQYQREFSIRKKDIDYLRELCERYRVEYIEL